MRWRTAHKRSKRRQRPVARWLRDVERILSRRVGFKCMPSLRVTGKTKIRLLGRDSAVVAEPSEPPRIISWDEAGTITEEQIEFLSGLTAAAPALNERPR